MNCINLTGRLVRNPELRRTSADTAVTSFTVAVQRSFDKNATDFIDCVAWRDQAEFVKQWFTKGQRIAVTGRLQIRDWTGKDGSKKRAAEVVVDRVEFDDDKKKVEEWSDVIESEEELPF